MEKQTMTSMRWVLGVVLLLAGALISATVLTNSSLAQLENQPVNLNLNVNNENPVVGQMVYRHDNGGTETPVSLGGIIPGIVNGSVNAIAYLNAWDENGYDYQTINVSARLIRTTGVSAINGESGGNWSTAFNYVSIKETQSLPMGGPVACTRTALYNAGTGVNTGGTWRCAIQMHYLSDPTTNGSSVNATVNFEAERWAWVIGYSDGIYSGVYDGHDDYVEYPNILGLAVTPSISFGPALINGAATGLVNATVSNLGNQQLDVALEVNKQTDATAWVCSNGGNPLVSDIHHMAAGGSTTYSSMTPLTLNLANTGNRETTFDLERAIVRTTPSTKNEGFKFASTQVIKPGICTLSSIVVSALAAYP